MALTENQKLWVAALRSGEFKQGKHVLHQVDTNLHCCLGVACEVAARNGVEVARRIATVNGIYEGEVTVYDNQQAGLPESVQQWLGLSGFMGGTTSGALTVMNDTGKTFSEIADLIESEPEGLFVKEGE